MLPERRRVRHVGCLGVVPAWYHHVMTPCDNDSHFGSGRVTARRRAIAAAADGLGSAFTVDDLLEAARQHSPGVGVATVYRAVAAMESAGALERVGSRNGSALYVRCTREGHHHHLICTSCGKVTHTACPLLQAESDAAPGHDGFIVTSHEITLYGLCRECAALHESAPPDATTGRRKD
jgi:Fur family transcriptional regulator, ferric uptake regulator